MTTAENKTPAKVLVGCRLPHGLIIEHPTDPNKKVELQGRNKSRIIGATHCVTEVDGEFWQAWQMFHEKHPALKSGAIFVAKDSKSVKAKARELEKQRTGFEQMSQAQGDLKKLGIESASNKE